MAGIRVEGNTSGNVAEVDANNNLKVNLPTTAANSGVVQIVLNSAGDTLSTGDDSRLKISMEQVLFYSRPEGAAIDARFWNSFTSTFTVTSANGQYTMNAGSSLTASAYAILQSTRNLLLLTEYPIYFQVRFRAIPQPNSVIEIGLGNVATTAAPTDGVFIRWNSAGQLQAVMNNNGTETIANLGSITSADYYNLEVRQQENLMSYHLESSDGATVIADGTLAVPVTAGSPTATVHLPFVARVYNTATPPVVAPQLFINAVNVQQTDLDMGRPWHNQMGSSGRLLHSSPVTPYAQTSNHANSTVPATATLSNTAASYTTLGGKFLIVNPTAAETDFVLFGYQVPSGYQLMISDIQITTNLSATGGTVGTAYSAVLEWALGVSSSAVSLATADSFTAATTGFTWAPRRYTLGNQGMAFRDATLVLTGYPLLPALTFSLATALVVDSGRFVQIILRIPVSAWVGGAAPTATLRGCVFINGH